MRVGHGFDVHRLTPDKPLVLGGVTIPHDQGLLAHSDGDVLIHALCDALLGAAGLGDIGHYFPDSSAEFAGIDSRILLRRVVELLGERQCKITNIDVTIVAQAPKLVEYIAAMKDKLSADTAVATDRISIKATTTEGLGFSGRKEGIAAYAVVLLNE